jgi:hypothetical protein
MANSPTPKTVEESAAAASAILKGYVAAQLSRLLPKCSFRRSLDRRVLTAKNAFQWIKLAEAAAADVTSGDLFANSLKFLDSRRNAANLAIARALKRKDDALVSSLALLHSELALEVWDGIIKIAPGKYEDQECLLILEALTYAAYCDCAPLEAHELDWSKRLPKFIAHLVWAACGYDWSIEPRANVDITLSKLAHFVDKTLPVPVDPPLPGEEGFGIYSRVELARLSAVLGSADVGEQRALAALRYDARALSDIPDQKDLKDLVLSIPWETEGKAYSQSSNTFSHTANGGKSCRRRGKGAGPSACSPQND